MKKPSLTLKIYIGLIVTFIATNVVKVIYTNAPQSLPAIQSARSISTPSVVIRFTVLTLIFFSGLGFCGIKLSQKRSFFSFIYFSDKSIIWVDLRECRFLSRC
jgi:hypothetical protein